MFLMIQKPWNVPSVPHFPDQFCNWLSHSDAGFTPGSSLFPARRTAWRPREVLTNETNAFYELQLDAHTTASDLFEDAAMRDGLTDD